MVNKLSKNDFVANIAEHAGVTKRETVAILHAQEEVLKKSLKDGSSINCGLFTVCVKKREARKGRNPQTGKEINIPAKRTVSFKVSKALKLVVN